MIDYKIVSADDHMDLPPLPPSLWRERLSPEWRDRAPTVQETLEGTFWFVDGVNIGPSGKRRNVPPTGAIARSGIEDNGFRPSTPELRLADMDMDGVYAQVIYGPPLPLKINDRGLKYACMQAYNDWAAEFNTADPDRLCVLAYLTAMMPDEATREMQRVGGLGHRGAVLNVFDSPKPVHAGEWESLWATVEESGVPLSFHLGGGTNLGPVSGSWEMAAFVAIVPMHLDEALASMIFCGALERHPKMKLVLGESGIGWIPYLLERMDLEYKKHTPHARDYRITTLPSELFANQVYATFQEDRVGMKLIDQIGVDNVMWASDYPHPDSTFPNSMQAIEEAFEGLDPGIRRKVTCDTAAKLYGITGGGLS